MSHSGSALATGGSPNATADKSAVAAKHLLLARAKVVVRLVEGMAQSPGLMFGGRQSDGQTAVVSNFEDAGAEPDTHKVEFVHRTADTQQRRRCSKQ
jgi:hypothetical protein